MGDGQEEYIRQVLEAYRKTPGTMGTVRRADRMLAAQLYQISPHNPLLLGATAIVLALAALLACLIPARRATHVDPIETLRTE